MVGLCRNILVVLAVFILVSACQPSNLGNDSNTEQGPGGAPSVNIVSHYIKGPVTGAQAYLFDENHNQIAGPVTTVEGMADFGSVEHTGLVYTRFYGGEYVDEATGSTVTLDSNFSLRSAPLTVQANQNISLSATPLSEIGFVRAESDAGSGAVSLSSVLTEMQVIADEFGLDGIDLSSTVPTPMESISGTSDADLYGAVLAAITQQMVTASEDLQTFIDNTATEFDEQAYSEALDDLTTNPNTSGYIDASITQTVNNEVEKYRVSGSVTGLNGVLVLELNLSETVTLNADGLFAFDTLFANGENFTVVVSTDPDGQTCSISGGTGSIANADVDSVSVSCSNNPIPTYSVGGSVEGLNGTLKLRNNGGDDLSVTANGTFNFGTKLVEGSAYDIAVYVHPIGQTCTVSNASGVLSNANVTSIAVSCTDDPVPTYAIGGSVSGLNGSLVLQNNGVDDLTVTADGNFAFSTKYVSDSNYSVGVSAQPSGQTCVVSNGTGSVNSLDVSDILVTCTTDPIPTYSIGGTVVGLSGTLVLRNNGGDDLTVTADGNFSFTSESETGSGYDISVYSHPMGQTCVVSSGSGSVADANVSSVFVDCSTDPVPTYAIGGNVAGLNGNLVLQNNGTDDLLVSVDGTFSFSGKLTSAASYNVTVSTQPEGQTCEVTGGTGTVGSAEVTSVSVTCSTDPVLTYSIGGSVSGLSGTVVLQNNNGDDLTVTANGIFSFSTQQEDATSFNVTVSSQPTGQTCDVTSGSGLVNTADVTNISVSCSTDPVLTYSIGGSISGLSGNVVLQNNGADDLSVSGNGSFTFVTKLTESSTYNVAVSTQPVGQTCVVSNSSGTVAATNVSNVMVTCTNDPVPTYSIGGSVSGLSGTLVLQNNTADDMTITADGSFTFETKLESAESYSVTISTQPSGQTCSVSNGSGTIANVDITSVSINCENDNVAPVVSNLVISDDNGGSYVAGTTLTLSYTYSDADGDLEGDTAIQWRRDTQFISGETSTNYTLTQWDKGSSIDAIVLPQAQTGELTGVAVTSGSIVAANSPPTAMAGSDQSVLANDVVTLNGAGSRDGDGNIASYLWSQLSGTTVTFDDASLMSPTFTSPNVISTETLSFRLTVTDNDGATNTGDVSVNVQVAVGSSPVVDAGTTISATSLATANLNGTATDDGSIVNVQWVLIPTVEINELTIASATSSSASFITPDVSVPLSFDVRFSATDNDGNTLSDIVTVNVSPYAITPALNDTGITTCVNANTTGQVCAPQGYEEQDGDTGRDANAIISKIGFGPAAFDYTKLDENGVALADDAAGWSCVRDNVSGLIWEHKEPKNSTGLRSAGNYYTWYNSSGSNDGGDPGTANGATCSDTGYCDSEKYVQRVNAVGLCGATDWRLPTVSELYSRKSYSDTNDNDAYLKADMSCLLTSTPDVWDSSSVRSLFTNCWKNQPNRIILVREAP